MAALPFRYSPSPHLYARKNRPPAIGNDETKAINMKLVSKDNPALQLDLPTRDKVMITFDSRLPDEEHLYNLPIPSLMKFFVHPFYPPHPLLFYPTLPLTAHFFS